MLYGGLEVPQKRPGNKEVYESQPGNDSPMKVKDNDIESCIKPGNNIYSKFFKHISHLDFWQYQYKKWQRKKRRIEALHDCQRSC